MMQYKNRLALTEVLYSKANLEAAVLQWLCAIKKFDIKLRMKALKCNIRCRKQAV